jgi:hypothetical protein
LRPGNLPAPALPIGRRSAGQKPSIVTCGPLLVRRPIDPDLADVAISIITFGYGGRARLTVFGPDAGTPAATIRFSNTSLDLKRAPAGPLKLNTLPADPAL